MTRKAKPDRCAGCRREPGSPQPRAKNDNRKKAGALTELTFWPNWPPNGGLLCQHCGRKFFKHTSKAPEWMSPQTARKPRAQEAGGLDQP